MSASNDKPVGPACTEPGCVRPAYARGRCQFHWAKHRRASLDAGTWDPIAPGDTGAPRPKKVCTQAGCDRPPVGRGLCQAHYKRLRKGAIAAGIWEGSRVYRSGWTGDPDGHADAGQKGGRAAARDRDHMARIGQMGGVQTASKPGHMAAIGRRGGAAVSEDREHMAKLARMARAGEKAADAEDG